MAPDFTRSGAASRFGVANPYAMRYDERMDESTSYPQGTLAHWYDATTGDRYDGHIVVHKHRRVFAHWVNAATGEVRPGSVADCTLTVAK